MKKMTTLKLRSLFASAAILLCLFTNAQNNIGIGTAPNASAKLDVSSTTQGMLVPRMTANQRGLIATPATGLMVFQTDGTAGFYFYNGTAWTAVGAPSTSSLPNANVGHGTNGAQPASFISPFAASQSTSISANSCFYANTGATINVTFYTFDDEGVTFEVFEVIPVNNANSYSTSGSALASCNTSVWTSGAPITASLSYTLTTGKLYTIKVRPTVGGNFLTNSGFMNTFYAN